MREAAETRRKEGSRDGWNERVLSYVANWGAQSRGNNYCRDHLISTPHLGYFVQVRRLNFIKGAQRGGTKFIVTFINSCHYHSHYCCAAITTTTTATTATTTTTTTTTTFTAATTATPASLATTMRR
ncbi:hypothetical protein E2C01_038969 [Portunus trituberculatus]|uniref:Uncharacterized protein n=1 Tax=Portunus trituberculatus TaxID=210409 RepID=A0A5B7FLH1_PORTR|nr:hypothetical protein [Portunus trituberculatus]